LQPYPGHTVLINAEFDIVPTDLHSVIFHEG
jgi:hypothetical protein